MIYEINGYLLSVENDLLEFNDLIYGRFSQFSIIKDKIIKKENYLKFGTDCVDICLKNKIIKLKKRVIKTDLYTIINNVIAYLINDNENMFIHSVVVSKEDKGIMILGGCGQGKSTLAYEMEKKGYRIVSTDQTWLTIKKNKLIKKIGSRFYLEENKTNFIDKELSDKEINIQKIIRIVGVCDNGIFSYTIDDDIYHNVKNLSVYTDWNYNVPIFTDEKKLYDSTQYTKKFLERVCLLKIPIINIRGDKKIISEKIEVI